MEKFICKIIILSLVTFLGIFSVPVHAQKDTVIRVDPLITAVDPGESFTLDIWVEDVKDLSAFDVTLYFSPDHLMVNSLTLGGFLRSGLGGSEFNNETGIIHFYNAILSGEPVTGTGILFTIQFTAKDVDANTSISIDEDLTELVEAGTIDLIPYTTENGVVKIGEGSAADFNNFLPLVLG